MMIYSVIAAEETEAGGSRAELQCETESRVVQDAFERRRVGARP